MTRESATLLTNSQEELLLQEYMVEGVELGKELGSHLDIVESYPSFSGLSDLNHQSSFLQQNMMYEHEQDESLVVDNKLCLQQQDESLLVDNKLCLQQQIAAQQQQQLLQEQQYLLQQQPPPTNFQSIPNPIQCKEEFAGDYNFQLILNNSNSTKNWIYSEKLQKVFINMEQTLPLQFMWTPPQDGLWVRATMVYKLDQHRSQPVVRCHNHMAPDNSSNRNVDQRKIKHVVRCTHETATYDSQNGHLSVLTPLGTPEAGVDSVPMDFSFYCKNSCASGMNRRPTELIFTLETEQNLILGRRKLEVRVCSCPKRDKEKEEGEDKVNRQGSVQPVQPGKKRKIMSSAPPPGKKIAVDNRVYSVNFNIVGRDNYNAVLKFAHDVMAGTACRTNNHELFKPYMDEVLKKYN